VYPVDSAGGVTGVSTTPRRDLWNADRRTNPRAVMKVLLAGGGDEVTALSGPLASAGWDVISAADAATALMLARRDPPDAVVVTAALPGGRGHGLVERLRHLAPTSMVPVVGLASEPELVAALDAAGADRCLPADVDPDELFTQLVEVTGAAATGSAPTGAEGTGVAPTMGASAAPARVTGRVLVVEDEDGVRSMLTEALELEGHQVAALGSGAAVVEACRADMPDVVLLDVVLPGISGLDLLAMLKADPTLHHLPVLLVSARDDETVVEGLRRGAHDYIRKPFDLKELLARVEGALAGKQARDELAGYATQLEATALIDLATGIENRRSAEIHLERMSSQAARTGRPLSALLLGVGGADRPTQRADLDPLVAAIAQRLLPVCRTADVVARWGDQEFLVLLPNTDQHGADVAARRVGDTLRAAAADVADVTVAYGVATLRHGPEQLLADAEAALDRTRAEGTGWPAPRAADLDDGARAG
jgi:diguanylate cyclase (GGDEF)-like protein